VTRIVLIGGGGFAKEVLEIANLSGHEVVGYVGSTSGIVDKAFWGDLDSLLERRSEFDAVCIAFGAVNRSSAANRASVTDWLVSRDFVTLSLISPYAVRSKGVVIEDGAIVCHGVVMSVDAHVGAFAILNTNAIVGHDAVIGRNVTMAPGAFVGGNATIGDNSLIGPGAMVLEGRTVGRNVVIGIGGTVLRNIKDGATIMPIRSRVLK
jgi:acetyltransferase EpsM